MRNKEGFAKRLRIIMARENVTQKALAAELGLTSSAVSLYCRGKAYPECEILVKIADIFGVTADYLLTGISPENKRDSKNLGLSDMAIERLSLAMRGDWGKETSSVLEFLLTDKNFYSALEHCAQGAKTGDTRGAILMCSNLMYQVIDAEMRVGKETSSPNSDN